MTDTEILKILQKKQVDMLEWFHNFCVNHNLKYYVIGGTMLGAARHGGFIPWDDDIDVGMPREDYNMLIEMMGSDVTDNYQLESPQTSDDDYCYPYSKLYDTNTTLVENYRYPLKRGIFIDIFPLDGLSNNASDSKKLFQSFEHKYNLYLTTVVAIKKERKWYKNLAIIISRFIPRAFFNGKQLIVDMNNTLSKKKFYDFAFGGNVYGNWGIREIMPTKIYGVPKLYKFEHLEIYGVEKFDEYLTNLYGEWRKLPSEEKQVSHHDYIDISFDKGYLT